MNSTQVFEKRKIAVTIGIDLAKDHCDVVAYNADNKICFTKANMTYPKLMEWLANTPPAVRPDGGVQRFHGSRTRHCRSRP